MMLYTDRMSPGGLTMSMYSTKSPKLRGSFSFEPILHGGREGPAADVCDVDEGEPALCR